MDSFFALVEQGGEFRLADHLGELVVGAESRPR